MRRTTTAAAAAALLLTLSSCGSEGADGESMNGMNGNSTDMSAMNDPDATPADRVDGEVSSGSFSVLDTAPPGSDDVSGDAWLAQNADGTTVTLRFTGLEPGTDYVAHLHEKPCAQDAGGDHFQFEEGGATTPPNEVHLAFTSTAEGDGEATVTSDRQVGAAAQSAVVHPAGAMDNRLACADFS